MLNIQGMDPSPNSNSFYKLINIIEEHLAEALIPIPIIAISETWLKPHISDAQITIPGYQIVRADRKHRDRGGCLLYVNDDLPIIDEELFDNGTCELAVCVTKPSNIIIVSLYRPPETPEKEFSEMLQFLQTYIDKVTVSNNKMQILIMGDFNLPCISWTDITIKKSFSRHTTDCAKALLTFMEHNFITVGTFGSLRQRS